MNFARHSDSDEAGKQKTVAVQVGSVQLGGGAPVVVQAMTNTNTADAIATTQQICELANAGAELIRFTVDTEAAAATTPSILHRVRDAGCMAPLIGDFHYNGHTLLRNHPACAEALDKYRINPGNVGAEDHFSEICRIATDLGKAVRIGVNAGSLDRDLVRKKLDENTQKGLGLSPSDVIDKCMVLSALDSAEAAVAAGLPENRLVLSCKTSEPVRLVRIYRELSRRTSYPLHLGLTEAGLGMKGVIWSVVPMGILLAEGIGDTIRVSLTPRPDSDRREEVYAACSLLQCLGLRMFAPTVTSCPGCGRTTSTTFLSLAEEVQHYLHERMPSWRTQYKGVETMTVAVMGCIVNGPGESRAADIGICLPGSGEEPRCPVFVNGRRKTTLSGPADKLAKAFEELIEEYVCSRYPKINDGKSAS